MHNREIDRFKAAFRETELYKQYSEHMPDKALFKYKDGVFEIIVVETCWQMFQFPRLITSNPRSVRLHELKSLNKWNVYKIAELTGAAPSTVCVWLSRGTKRPIPENKLQMLEDEHNKINRRSDG